MGAMKQMMLEQMDIDRRADLREFWNDLVEDIFDPEAVEMLDEIRTGALAEWLQAEVQKARNHAARLQADVIALLKHLEVYRLQKGRLGHEFAAMMHGCEAYVTLRTFFADRLKGVATKLESLPPDPAE